MEHFQQSIYCPNCGSTSLHAGQKGYDGTKGALGTALAGSSGVGLGMKDMNTIQITCLACGFVFNPGEGAKTIDELKTKKQAIIERKSAEDASKSLRITIGVMIILITLIVLWAKFSYLWML